MSKYEPLQAYLARQSAPELPMTFEQVERLLNFPLPPPASGRVGLGRFVQALSDA